MKFLTQNWCGLHWTEWIPFENLSKNKTAMPRTSGLYRIKPAGQSQLAYIGQTGRDLYERVWSLASNTLKDEMPFNDPHTAAPSLWAWKDAEGMQFECSVAQYDESEEQRKGVECNLLWHYRVEYRKSTMCNHGRFHERYVKSLERKKGVRGHRLLDNEVNPAGGESTRPLVLSGTPTSPNFMGIKWTVFERLEALVCRHLPVSGGVYRLIDMVDNKVIYFGQSLKIGKRLSEHAGKDWGTQVSFSYVLLPDYPPYQLHEIENDLIGGYFELTGEVPRFQFRNKK